ncbi:MAG: thiopeptide-type bacteriocin biosynthesis protein [Flavobacterium sp.]|uniref:thiopeptide-type bacteriocin biosynthesis protein n=1 Tax=Flavobacterium sp. TaxID=239 RepID=UPI00326558A1
MKRKFIVGSEWLYYKVYTGVKISDIILVEKLRPIIKELKSNNLIKKWFFIRYKDPDEHLRLRFYSSKKQNSLQVIQYLHPVLDVLVEEDIVWKVQLDTYQREIERYGSATMKVSESLFHYDSEMILEYLLLKPNFLEEDTQLLFSFLAIDSFLNAFSLQNSQKLELLEKLQSSFKEEFNADKILKKELDKNYRILFSKIVSILKNKDGFLELHEIVTHKENKIKKLILEVTGKLEISLHSFISSHIHMIINRQYVSRQRQYECLIYDHLYRYYKTIQYEKLK